MQENLKKKHKKVTTSDVLPIARSPLHFIEVPPVSLPHTPCIVKSSTCKKAGYIAFPRGNTSRVPIVILLRIVLLKLAP